MTFYLPNPSSPPDDDTPSAALHSPLHTFSSSGISHQPSQVAGDHETIPEKLKTGLEIIFSPEIVYLKGTGPDIEPSLVSGHVALYLTESTSIKEITLSFKGKARLPAISHDSLV